MSIFTLVLLFFGLTQAYWGWKLWRLVRQRTPSTRQRLLWATVILAVYFLLLAYNFNWFGRDRGVVHLTPGAAFLNAPFAWWAASSVFGFLVVLIFGAIQGLAAAASWIRRKASSRPSLESPSRRVFLERTASLASATPFVAGAYGLFYGRLNLQVSHQRTHLANLPRAFEGFRIAQLSDIHIGPFMPAGEIRKYVDIANQLKPDLIALTGDFVTWDADTQQAVVAELARLRAPFGVFGCLGNHDTWAGVEDSITLLFRQAGIRILRQEQLHLTTHGESVNLIGVDFQSSHRFGPSPAVPHLLENIVGLIDRNRVNILLSHNPDTFDRAAELGVELSLAGHTHGGQLALEFISPEIAPSRLVTPYVAGWFQKSGSQLYVNRGIGTIGVPMRVGAPPEITVFELRRG